MSNGTEAAGGTPNAKSGTIVVAIIVPAALIIVLIVLIFMGFIIPRLIHNESTIKEERWQSRQNELDSHIKSQSFYVWLASQKEKNPASLQMSDPICAICLDEFVDDAQIRGLECSHAFHSHCLDEWFTKYNEYCPLCHRPIIPGSRAARRRTRERLDPTIPMIVMV
ncbi:RING-finger-containing ubiquitin ligase [Pyrenophora tritici-repentis]|nr:RING-finger-containing ubiquitin ligase [Pyrenophora tritici-repentis]KAI1533277.1 RING-finger-containing ubiquitin ligase [Pyrenophora tritici-repentis]KAI1586394.1 RING-finger-containing ubiquitin ligase [Pyrenophora tritici-repentis]